VQVAIKRLDRRGMQGDKEFGMEASMLCSLKHANIVTLRGVCVEGDNRCTIFDLAANVRVLLAACLRCSVESRLSWAAHMVAVSSQELNSMAPSDVSHDGRSCRARYERSWT
jgi:Protein tyrosine and serine/threonine kinase